MPFVLRLLSNCNARCEQPARKPFLSARRLQSVNQAVYLGKPRGPTREAEECHLRPALSRAQATFHKEGRYSQALRHEFMQRWMRSPFGVRQGLEECNAFQRDPGGERSGEGDGIIPWVDNEKLGFGHV